MLQCLDSHWFKSETNKVCLKLCPLNQPGKSIRAVAVNFLYFYGGFEDKEHERKVTPHPTDPWPIRPTQGHDCATALRNRFIWEYLASDSTSENWPTSHLSCISFRKLSKKTLHAIAIVQIHSEGSLFSVSCSKIKNLMSDILASLSICEENNVESSTALHHRRHTLPPPFLCRVLFSDKLRSVEDPYRDRHPRLATSARIVSTTVSLHLVLTNIISLNISLKSMR